MTRQQLEKLLSGEPVQIGSTTITPIGSVDLNDLPDELKQQIAEDEPDCDCFKCKVRAHVEAKLKAKDSTLDTVEECRLELEAAKIAFEGLAAVGGYKPEAFQRAADTCNALGYKHRAMACQMLYSLSKRLELLGPILKREEEEMESR